MGKRLVSFLVGLIGIVLYMQVALAQPNDYQFARYSTERGLSHNQVNCFLKDRQGFVWIGTADGLNRFDGYSFKIFKHDPADSTTIDDHYIDDLFEDSEGYIWISTHKGYSVYDPATERISSNSAVAAKRLGLPDANFSRVIRTASGDYWINHNRLGLLRYKPATRVLLHVKFRPKENLQAGAVISDFNEDKNGNLWVVYSNGYLAKINGKTFRADYRSNLLSNRTISNSVNHRVFVDEDGEPWVYVTKAVRGLFYFDLKNNRLVEGNTSSANMKLTNNIVSAVISGPDGRVWVGTDHGGINIIDKKTLAVSVLSYNPNDPKTISQNSVMALYKDPSGMIWAGTFKKGFCNYHKNLYKFTNIRHLSSVPGSLPFDDVSVFVEDRKGNIWVGSNGGGLIYFDRKNNTFRQYRNIPGNPASLSNNVIVSLFMDSSDILWVGTYFGGLNSFDGKTFKRYQHNPSDPTSLIDDRVWEIYEDSQRRLWVGTLGDGLDLFDRTKNTFTHFRPNAPNSINSDYIAAMMEDKDGDLWIGTAAGIDVLMRETGKFIHYGHSNNDPTSLSNDGVTAINQDGLGNIWVGTVQGLNLFDKKTGRFKVYDMRDGLPDNSIVSVVIDNKENLWLGTPKGLVSFNIAKRRGTFPETVRIRVYNEVDGLQGRSFNENAALRLRSGEVVFGGASGFTVFSPESLDDDVVHEGVMLTDFQIFNKSVKPGEELDGNQILSNSIS
ncbi:MAG TPA: two-component regulator propeller domain-containing protein, partial [Dyadobacter sp.]|nr:two-component regulator propeller domain-containing protein [Dyadobacter sp.]